MDRSEQLPANNQLTTSPEELQIIKRITRLTLLLGIWKLQILRGQYPSFRGNIDNTFSLQLGILGINFIGMGCLSC